MHRAVMVLMVGILFMVSESCTAQTSVEQKRVESRSAASSPVVLPGDQADLKLDVANMREGVIVDLQQDTAITTKEGALSPLQEVYLEIGAQEKRKLTWDPAKFGTAHGWKLPTETLEPDSDGQPLILTLLFSYHPQTQKLDLRATNAPQPLPSRR